MAILFDALVIFFLRVLGITVATLSTIMTVQGRRLPAVLTGMLSALVYVLAIGKVVADLDNVVNIAAYVIGFGTGTWVGMVLEQRMALGYAEVRVISTEKSSEIATALRAAGYGATELYGRGRDAEVGLIESITPRKGVNGVIAVVNSVDEHAIVTVGDARTVQHGYWKRELRR